MDKTVGKIQQPIENELKEFEKRFHKAMQSKVPLLDTITNYIVKRKGKQMRPMFVFLSCKTCGNFNDAAYTAAILIELLHTATLVHDDVVDDSNMRRGFFSINALWKNKIAVLVGDYLLSKGLITSLENHQEGMLHTVSNAVKLMSEGELLQIEKARKLDVDENIYFEIITRKTASLIAACCKSGAQAVTNNNDVLEKMRLFGEYTGIAFQIKDDLFDYGISSKIGKPVGVDIKEKKMTLPLLYALKQCSSKEKQSIKKLIKKHSEEKQIINKIINFVVDNNGLKYAEDVMKDYQQKALSVLYSFPKSEARNALELLVNYTINRTK